MPQRLDRHLAILKWITIIVPAIAIFVVETIRHDFIEPVTEASRYGNLIIGLIAFGCTFLFAQLVFRTIEGMQAALIRRNAELEAINAIASTAGTSIDVNVVARQAGEVLKDLFAADDVVIALRQPGDSPRREGASEKEQQSPGHPATERTDRARIDIPLRSHRRVLGVIQLRRRRRGFDPAEQQLLHLVGDTLSMSIENALLLEQLRSAAVADERGWLAREMHDGVAQVLAYMLMQIDIVDVLLREGDSPRARQELEKLRGAAERANADVRAEIAGLRLLTNTHADLVDRIRAYVDDFEDQTGIAATLTVEGTRSVALARDCELQLVRILQESLANVRKHSGASTVNVRLAARPDQYFLVVEDNGRGFVPNGSATGRPGRHFGLATMRERAESLGGRFMVESNPGTGTRISVRVPLYQKGAPSHAETAPAVGR